MITWYIKPFWKIIRNPSAVWNSRISFTDIFVAFYVHVKIVFKIESCMHCSHYNLLSYPESVTTDNYKQQIAAIEKIMSYLCRCSSKQWIMLKFYERRNNDFWIHISLVRSYIQQHFSQKWIFMQNFEFRTRTKRNQVF